VKKSLTRFRCPRRISRKVDNGSSKDACPRMRKEYACVPRIPYSPTYAVFTARGHKDCGHATATSPIQPKMHLATPASGSSAQATSSESLRGHDKANLSRIRSAESSRSEGGSSRSRSCYLACEVTCLPRLTRSLLFWPLDQMFLATITPASIIRSTPGSTSREASSFKNPEQTQATQALLLPSTLDSLGQSGQEIAFSYAIGFNIFDRLLKPLVQVIFTLRH